MSKLMTLSKMTSMQIADITGKEHKNVLSDIRDEVKKLETAGVSTELKFQPSERKDSTGRTIPYYELSKEGVLQLAARYDAVVRAKLIDLAMSQEKPKLPITYKEALLALVASEEEKEALQLQSAVLTTENKLLTKETLTWADRKVIEAIVKKVGGKIGYDVAWREFKKELLYKNGICLNSRVEKRERDGLKKVKLMDTVRDDELNKCLSTATALARHHKVDISAIIGKFENWA